MKSIPYDNSNKFAYHARNDRALGSTGYISDLFSSWQRGSNENLKDLASKDIPIKLPLSSMTYVELAFIENRFNNRQRKQLEFETPSELFTQELNSVALRW